MVQIYALCVGYLEMDRASMLSDLAPGQPWTIPVSSYLIAHPKGRLLFDTGVHCQSITDPLGRLGEERAKRIAIRSQAGDDVVSQLATLGLKPDDVTYVANSHFHFDHCGRNEFFPQATFLVQQRELEAARHPGGTAAEKVGVQQRMDMRISTDGHRARPCLGAGGNTVCRQRGQHHSSGLLPPG